MFKIKKQNLFIIIISIVLLLILDSTSIVSYIYTLIIFYIINDIISKRENNSNFIYFHFYLYLAIIIFLYQRFSIPNYLGLTGPEGGIGTDDVRYYAWLVEGNVPYDIQFNLYGYTHPFSRFLNILYPFKINNPLNIIIFNILGITFLPFYVYKLSLAITSDVKTSNLAKRLTLFCPYLMAMGLILMRDMLIATLIIASLYYFIQKKYIIVLLIAPLIIYIRFGSIIFLVLGIFIFSINFIKSKVKNKFTYYSIIILTVGIILIGFNALMPHLETITNGKLSSDIFRSEFYNKIYSMDENATLLILMSLPTLLRTISLTLFFYFLPFLNFNIFPDGIFNIRSLLVSLTPIYMFFLWTPIFKTILNSLFNRHYESKVKTIVWISILFALALGTVSLQARHKTVLFPILFILAAYGWYIPTKRYTFISRLLTFMLIVVQVIAITF